MKVLVIADLEDVELDLGCLKDPALSLILSCGDVYRRTYEAIRGVSPLPLYAVHGNHDDAEWLPGITDLHMRPTSFNGVSLGGFEGAWRYKPAGRFLYTEPEVERFMSFFPAVDVFVSHNPLAGVHDIADGVHNGFGAFRSYVERKKPKWFLHGHSNRPGETRLGDTRVVCVKGWTTIDL
jgi:Icc-related predicted phosphoesterase